MNSRTKKFLSYYKPYLGLLAADTACAVVVAAAALALPLCARYITNLVLEGHGSDILPQIYAVGVLMLALVAVHTACNFFVDYQGHGMGARMERDIRQELFDHYQKLAFRFYDEHKTGELMTRLTNDTFWLSELYHHGPEDLMISLLKFCGAFIILLQINVPLTLGVFLFLPLVAVYALYFSRHMNGALQTSRERVGAINAQAEDTLGGIRVVASFTNEGVESAEFSRENNRFLASRKDGYRSEAYLDAGMKAFTQLITVAVVVFGGAAIVNGGLQAGDLVTYLLYVAILIDPILRLANFTRLYQEGMTGFQRVMEMLEVAPEIEDRAPSIELGQVAGQVELRNVSFRYQQGHDHVLKNIDLALNAGEYVALVGPSGAGKTTLCSLIPRFYEVSAGKILVDGKDVRNICLRSLRQNIGVVQQDVYLFNGTVADNIRYGKLHASREEIVAAAKAANAHGFIMALPQGYDTDIGQRGVKLSGGQKQRLSIARVFLKDPSILIFDEATSALDNESEQAIRESLERLARRRTTLVIAHRLSTIRNAQRIVVLTDSGIEEQGTHEELIAKGGAYAGLYNMALTI
ncbi:MAG: ABC transporter ATP-binding protein [Caldilineaceae bacterium]